MGNQGNFSAEWHSKAIFFTAVSCASNSSKLLLFIVLSSNYHITEDREERETSYCVIHNDTRLFGNKSQGRQRLQLDKTSKTLHQSSQRRILVNEWQRLHIIYVPMYVVYLSAIRVGVFSHESFLAKLGRKNPLEAPT